MNTKIIEACQGPQGPNWGKFLVGRFTDEWERPVLSPGNTLGTMPLLARVGWGPEHLLVLDLQTGEAAVFRPGGFAKADLTKHKILPAGRIRHRLRSAAKPRGLRAWASNPHLSGRGAAAPATRVSCPLDEHSACPSTPQQANRNIAFLLPGVPDERLPPARARRMMPPAFDWFLLTAATVHVLNALGSVKTADLWAVADHLATGILLFAWVIERRERRAQQAREET